MATLREQAQWESGIYQLEKTDPVVGGEDGIANQQAKQLANRTAYLKQQTDQAKKDITNIQGNYAPINSPHLTGIPTAPTAEQNVNSTQIATTGFVKTAIANLVGSAPAALDTLSELATALGGDRNLKATLLNLIGQKVSKNGDRMSGKLWIEGNASGSHSQGGIGLVNTGGGKGTAVHFDGHLLPNKVNKGGMHISDSGDGGAEIAFLTTPAGDANSDRRHVAMVINKDGALWVKELGWLSAFVSEMRNKKVVNNTYYGNHYNGAEVYKFTNSSLMIVIMHVRVEGEGEFFLPEAFDGFATAIANDRYDGRHSLGISILGNNKVKIWGQETTEVSLIAIGYKR